VLVTMKYHDAIKTKIDIPASGPW